MVNTITLSQIALHIIKEQALIIGPLAWTEAAKVTGIRLADPTTEIVDIESSEPKEVINKLVAQYERLFGKLSHEICREAAHDLVLTLAPEEIPSSLS